ncbi:unnamed protein product [Lepeophtheirus salmonis]|uniref:(salmon louse) hypothetical protein n=1 Tax=Lepeophtheirus salmonis TaxID=72036 RepID=A0A7R8CWB7_LEPSM|nr:unnamed protein product [Lepeophtheirus salmonis]CAF2951849.1 unnamed protein product [Lepeophtheirus salmonis]
MVNENCIKNFIPEKNVSIDVSMGSYYGCQQYIQNKPVKFELWFAATPLGYTIQFYPHAGRDTYYKKYIVLGGSVCVTVSSTLYGKEPVKMARVSIKEKGD